MLALTREQLVEHLQEASALVDRYARNDWEFPTRVTAWMTEVETTLGRLRSPLVSLVAAERGKITAVDDGFRDPEIEGVNQRKALKATATLALGRVEAALRDEIHRIDARFDEMRERLAQLLALASTSAPIPLPPTEPRQAWLDLVWSGLAVNGETRSLYSYLGAALAPSDRTYLLDEMIRNLLGAQATPVARAAVVPDELSRLLAATGIDTIEKLERVGSTPRGLRRIAQAAETDTRTVRGWMKRLRLMHLEGVGPAEADLLVEGGVSSIKELRRRNPELLARTLRKVATERGAASPDVATVAAWVAAARQF